MLVFVTGATGFVGSALVRELLDAGHAVRGLARSDASAKRLAAAGAAVHRGTLEDLDALTRGVDGADAVVHTGFDHDFSRFAENCAKDRRAIEVLGAALVGSDRPLLVTSGAALLAPGRKATEADPAPPVTERFPRASEEAVAALVARGVRASTVRLPPSVHGEGDHAFVPTLITLARSKGISAYPDGGHCWSAVHRRDAARVYRLALEHGVSDGPFHAVAEESIPFRAIAEAIGKGLGVPVVALNREDTAAHFGWFAFFASLDMQVSSEKTRARLGWRPTQPGLLADLGQGHYFTSTETGH